MFLGLCDAFFFIFSVRHFWRKGGGFAVDSGHQQLVDAVVIDIHHFKFVAGEFHRIGAFRDLRSINIIKPPMVS